MNETLTDDLRRVLHQRADEIAERPAPGLVLGYTAAAPARSRRSPRVVAGLVAATTLAVALIAGRGVERTSTTDAPPVTETPTTFADANPDVLIDNGTAGDRTWSLRIENRGGMRRAVLHGDRMEGRFDAGPIGGAIVGEPPRFLSIGPCCRLNGWTIVVGEVGPQVRELVVTPDVGTPVRVSSVPDPGAPTSWRFVVAAVPPGASTATVALVTDDGVSHPVEGSPWDLSIIGG